MNFMKNVLCLNIILCLVKIHLKAYLQVRYMIMDGAQQNRSFVKLHFADGDPRRGKFAVSHPLQPGAKMLFLMDPKASHITYIQMEMCGLYI